MFALLTTKEPMIQVDRNDISYTLNQAVKINLKGVTLLYLDYINCNEINLYVLKVFFIS